MTKTVAISTSGARVPLKRQRYISSTGHRGVYQIPKLFGDSSDAGGAVMAVHDPQGSLGAKYPIAGEIFFVQKEGRRFVISHPRWSLTGRGTTLAAAEEDLRFHAANVAEILGRKAPSELGREAIKLLQFALSIS